MIKKRERKLWNRLSTLATLLNHHVPSLDSSSFSRVISSQIHSCEERWEDECDKSLSKLLAYQSVALSQGRDNCKIIPINHVKRSSRILQSKSLSRLPVPAKNLLDLPCELISQVLDFSLSDTTSSQDTFTYTQVLRTMRLVCRQFAALLQRRVLESLTISNIEMLTETLQFFESPKNINQLKFVKRLCISPKDLSSNKQLLFSGKIWELFKMLSSIGLNEVEIDHVPSSSSELTSKRDHSKLRKLVSSDCNFMVEYTCLETLLSCTPHRTNSQKYYVTFKPNHPLDRVSKSLVFMNPSFKGLDVTDTSSADAILKSYTSAGHCDNCPELQVLRIRSSKPILRRFWQRPMLKSIEILILDKITARLTHWAIDDNLPYEFETLSNLKLLVITGLQPNDRIDQSYSAWRESYGVKVLRAPEAQEFSIKDIMLLLIKSGQFYDIYLAPLGVKRPAKTEAYHTRACCDTH
ncbi:uncharacterized protein MELLADRAFT_103332 [Melampsora larici-populina 98AG31]|uniref:Uncharacterized protein n=1 Tax=Melampsora larici-populina (strain 98AG31 / pathotype 3-4-7) TaxID=747676 RepID=F4RA24_MELLP|nr:uncharacterized protein MELLADRAFT_103332 [Melampsora larici-populina 98AG31]EGG10643.1 hypothetical protein MELLADRAFT_103332 [Melampsora larici-populina 98AG31]